MNKENKIFSDEEIEMFHKYIELIDPNNTVLLKTKEEIAKTKELINSNNKNVQIDKTENK